MWEVSEVCARRSVEVCVCECVCEVLGGVRVRGEDVCVCGKCVCVGIVHVEACAREVSKVCVRVKCAAMDVI